MAAIAAAAAPPEGPVAPTPPSLTGDEWLKIPKSLPHDKITCLPITAAVVSIVISIIAVGLRLYTRHRLLRNLGFDDVCVVLALLGVIALAVAVFIQTDYGLGTHAWDLQDWSNTTMYTKLLFVQTAIYSASLLFIKLGISCEPLLALTSLPFGVSSSVVLAFALLVLGQYYRIFKHDYRYRIPFIIVICAVVGWAIASMFAMVFICYPVEEFWLVSPISGKCDVSRGYTVAVGNIVTDFILVVVPMPMIFQLSIKTPQKLNLLGLFAIGIFACVVSVLRLIFLPTDFDTTYSGARAASWTQAEVAAGVLGSSAMTLQPLIKQWAAKGWLAHIICRRPSKDGDGQTNHKPTLEKRPDNRPNNGIGHSPGKAPRLRSWEGSETELTRIADADEMETMRREETQSHISLTRTSPTFSYFDPHFAGGGRQQRRSRHDLDPCGLGVLARTQCLAGPGEDDMSPTTATADEEREKTSRRAGQLGILIKRAWSVQEHRRDEGP